MPSRPGAETGLGSAPRSETDRRELHAVPGAPCSLTLLWSVFLLVFRRADRLRVEYCAGSRRVHRGRAVQRLARGRWPDHDARLSVRLDPRQPPVARSLAEHGRPISAGLFVVVADPVVRQVLGPMTPRHRPARLQRGRADRPGAGRAVRLPDHGARAARTRSRSSSSTTAAPTERPSWSASARRPRAPWPASHWTC